MYTRFEGPTNTNEVRQQLETYVNLIKTVGEIIQVAGEIPSGALYAMLITSMDLRTYNNVLGILKRTGMVREKSYLLIWTGPKLAKSE